MFFKKRNKDPESENMKKCEAPNCPTPDLAHPKENLTNLEGLFLCQFCYTKQLSEKKIDTVVEGPKTKKVAQIETQRISAIPVWTLHNQKNINLSRIGPSIDNEKYLEEIATWKEILLSLQFEPEFSSVKAIIKFSKNSKIRILESSGAFLIASIANHEDYQQKSDELSLQRQLFEENLPELKSYEVNKLSSRNKDWLINNHVLSDDATKKEVLIIATYQNVTISTLEGITESAFTIGTKDTFFEFGRFFYFLNFIGLKTANQILVIKSETGESFLNMSFISNQGAFANVKITLQELYLAIPFVLDEQNHVPFLEGAMMQQEALTDVLKNDGTKKDLILNFFSKNKIAFDQSKPLITLNSQL